MKVYLISQPTILHSAWLQFLRDESLPMEFQEPKLSAAEWLVEQAGRLCYMSFGKGRKSNKEFCDNIISAGHFSVLEHANFTVLFTGISRSCTHELVRHRHFSYSQLSQRYVDHSSFEMICPQAIVDAGPELEVHWRSLMDEVQRFYAKLAETDEKATLAKKAVRTAARSVLPNAIETKIVVTGNARAWREFIAKRNTPFADPEIGNLAKQVFGVLHAAAPNLFEDMQHA